MYEKLAGMTGTADTEAVEFDKIYKLDVVVIPHQPAAGPHRLPDVVYRTERREVTAVRRGDPGLPAGQPALVGTISIEKSDDEYRSFG